MNTYYIINGNDLIVKWRFMINMTIKIDKIKKIKEIKNSLSSPAASLDNSDNNNCRFARENDRCCYWDVYQRC
jgi:hypothetical protein